jgi:putative DNA primase/helicase
MGTTTPLQNSEALSAATLKAPEQQITNSDPTLDSSGSLRQDGEEKILGDPVPHFPASFKAARIWCVWRYEERDGKETKVPYRPSPLGDGTYTMVSTKSNDRTTWVSFADACGAAAEQVEYHLGLFADGTHAFIDLDKCIGPDGVIEPWALDVLERISSYTELSPSKKGLHIFVSGAVSKASKINSCEIYSTGRFFTVTGDHVNSTPLIVNAMTEDALEELRDDIAQDQLRPYKLNKPAASKEPTRGGLVAPRPMTKKEREAKLAKLLSGDWESEFDSKSEAVHSVLQILARKHAGNDEKMRDEFEGSQLHELWSQKWERLGDTEIEKAIERWQKNGSPKWDQAFKNTDGGNAERLVKLHGENFRYLHDEQMWLCWDGKRWKRDAAAEIHRAAKKTVVDMYDEIGKIENEEARKTFGNFVRRSDSRALRENMVALARHEEVVSATADDFDRDNYLLNLHNGTYNLRVGQFYPHRKENLITKICPVVYDPTATCPRFLAFLQETFSDQPDIIPFLQRSFGYSLSGSVDEQCFWLLIGEGRNGKSVLLSILEFILGDYAVAASFDIFMMRRKDGGISPRDGMASLMGARFVRASESEQDRRFSESTIKNITGGEKIQTAKMYSEDFTYLPTFKVWLSTNYEPSIRGTDDGIWRRIRRVNFNQQVPPEKVDPELVEKLKTEAPGILNWALEGFRQYQEHGLSAPSAVRSATEEYRKEQNPLREFIEQCCASDPLNPGLEVKASELLNAYNDWARGHRRGTLSLTSLGRAVTQLGCKRDIRRTGTFYLGLDIWRGPHGSDRVVSVVSLTPVSEKSA